MKLALFPLELTVFPGELLNLHIFEERYKQLINEVKEDQIRFGIPCFNSAKQMTFGTEISLKSIARIYASGEMDIMTEGLQVFKIINFESKMEGKLYPGGEVAFLENEYDGTKLLQEEIRDKVNMLYSLTKVNKKAPNIDSDFSVFDIAHKIGLSFQKEQELLCITKESLRQKFVIAHLNEFIPAIRESEKMKEKIAMNGHFKNLIPPADF